MFNMNLLKAQKHVQKTLIDRNIHYCSPTNLQSEKNIFFKRFKNNETYNPRFVYRKTTFDTRKVNYEIDFLIQYHGKYQKIINGFGNRSKLFLGLISGIGTIKFTHYSRLLYGVPDKNEIKYAKHVLKSHENEKTNKRQFNAELVKQEFQKNVENYNWNIRIQKGIPSKIKCSPFRREIIISKDAKFTKRELLRLEYHEIETHIKRSFNNQNLPDEIRDCFDYIETEEGLAVKMEELHNCLSPNQLRIYAGRLIAVQYAQSHSFIEVFQFLKTHGFNDYTAFIITSRCKRGLEDTTLPGGLTRDHIYISGKLKIDSFLKGGGNLNDLFLGKIGIKDIHHLKNVISS